MENVKTINSVIRTSMMLVFLGVFGYFGYLGYDQYIRPGIEAKQIKKQMEALQVKYNEQSAELAKTQTALKLIKVDQRRALVKILDKGTDKESGEPYFDVEFMEIDKSGKPISQPREFHCRGSLLFVDSWVVKFEDKYVEAAEDLRSASLCVFKSIGGDIDGYGGGHSLDRNDETTNTAYGTLNPMSEFEKKIWDDFWIVANDPLRQEELGIRANHGQVNYLQVQPGMVYKVDLRASDGLSLVPTTDDEFASSRPSG